MARPSLGFKVMYLDRYRGKRNTKLNANQVKQIRIKRICGASQSDLAKEYGVLPQTISALFCGKTWTDI